jgi:hypothetical protein
VAVRAAGRRTRETGSGGKEEVPAETGRASERWKDEESMDQ